MKQDGHDVIVVGGGFAGICCAAELVLRGAKPLLICESKEVGYLYRSKMIGKNRGMMQMPFRYVGWSDLHPDKVGGWWYHLVRQLNLPIRMHRAYQGLSATVLATGETHHVPICPTPASLTEIIGKIFPVPADALKGMERIWEAAYALPYQDLVKMHRITLAEWLEEQGADEFVSSLMMRLAAAGCETTAEIAEQYMSVFGFLALVRGLVCGEADAWAVYPDAREGLCVPMAREVEHRGGTVWRGRKVSQLLVEGGQAGSVVMEDGTEVSAPKVAIACGNGRIPGLLNPLPPEVAEVLAYESQLDGFEEYGVWAILDRPMGNEPKSWNMVVDNDGNNVLYSWSPGMVAPWLTEPGKHLAVSEVSVSKSEADALGGPEGVFAHVRKLTDQIHPGYEDSLVDYVTDRHLTWVGPQLAGPKLPRKSPTIENLWYVNECSYPFAAWCMEGSASTGILGARAMLSLV